jgi:hypothetical protein
VPKVKTEKAKQLEIEAPESGLPYKRQGEEACTYPHPRTLLLEVPVVPP